jgi:predicted patatin/cPLA2 family phospholipase
VAPARRLVERNVDPQRLRESGVEVRFGYVDMVTGRFVAASNRDHPDLIGAIIASGSIPVTFPPTELPGNELGLDGGVRNATPLAEGLEALRIWPAGEVPDQVWVLIPTTKPKNIVRPEFAGIELRGWLKIGDRAISLLRDEIHVNDVKHVLEINELVKNNCSPDPKYRYVDIMLVYPEKSLGRALRFEPERIRAHFKLGVNRAQEVDEPVKLPLS